MAQVKKFKTPAGPVTVEDENAVKPAGTSTLTGEVKKKYGKLIRNGVTYEMDDEKMKNLEQHITSMDPELQPYVAEDFKRLQNGEDVTLDTMLNRRDGIDDYTLLNDRQERRLKKNKAKEGFLNALFNTKIHKFNKATYALGQWNPETKTKPEEEVKKTPFGRGAGSFEYESLADDKFSYRSVLNGDEMEHFDRIYNFFVNPNDRNKYDTSSFTNMSSLIKWFDDMKDEQGNPSGKKFLDTLKAKILSGDKLDQNERDYLDAIGIGHNQTPSQETIDAKEKVKADEQLNIDWNNFDTNKVWSNSSQDVRDRYFISDGRGGYSLNKDAFFKDFDPTKNYYFNQEFAETYKGMPGVKDLVGKIYFNGKWYSDKDLKKPASELYQMLNNAVYDYFNKNKRGEYAEADKILKTSWDGRENLLRANAPENADYLGTFYKNNYLYQAFDWNKKGARYKGVAIPEEYEIVRGFNMDDQTFLDDGTGRRPYRYWILDQYGNPVSITNDPMTPFGLSYEDFTGLYDGTTDRNAQLLHAPKRVVTRTEGSPYNGMYVDDRISGSFKVYRRPGDSDFIHVSLPQQFAGVKGHVYKDMPIWLYDILSKLNINEMYDTQSQLLTKLFDLIAHGKDRIKDSELQSIFGDKWQEAKRYFMNPSVRIASPESFRRGGVLKAQGGTVVNLPYQDNSKEQELAIKKAELLNSTIKNPYQYRNLKNDFWTKVAQEDRAELTGLGLDAVGFALGFVPEIGDFLNLGFSTIGANIAYGIADRRKVKAGVLPPGTTVKNIGINTAMDVASLVPIVGDVANGAKWVDRMMGFLKRSGTYIDLFRTGMMLRGAAKGVAALNKALDENQELTLEEIKDLMYGVMSAIGFTGRAINAGKEAKLAHASHPGAESIPYKTKYKVKGDNGVEVEKFVEFSPQDVKTATELFLRGSKSKEALSKLIKGKYPDIPDSEISRIVGDERALWELGIKFNNRSVGPRNYSEAKAEEAPSKIHYFFHPSERREAIRSHEKSKIAEIGVTNKGLNKMATEEIVLRGKGVPDGYDIIKNKKLVRKDNTTEGSAPKQEQSGPSIKETPRTILTPEQAVNLFKTSGDKIAFLQKYDETLSSQAFKDFATSNPSGARSAVDKGVNEFIDRTIVDVNKRAAARTALSKEVNEKIKGLGYKFEKGGILKAQNGLGQWFSNAGEKINNFMGTYGHDIWNVVDSGARFANGVLYNTKSEKLNKDATNRAANILQPVKPVEIYSPQKINAGNAERQFAESQLQYNPIPTNDMNTYQAMKKEGYDKAHLGLANATRLDSQQDTENGMRGAEEKRHYANIASEYTNIGKKAVANAVLTNAQLKDTRLKANADSLNQLIYQGQAQRDEYRKEALAFMQEKDQWDLQDAMRKKFEEEKAKLFKDKPYDPGNAEHNKALNSLWKQIQLWGGETNLQNNFNRMSGGAQRWATNRGISFAAKGSKLRPVSEQIAINREKAKDQRQTNKEKSYNKMWENELKDAHKALDKMSERTHRILMKLLS